MDLAAHAYTHQTLALLASDLHSQVPSALGATVTLVTRGSSNCPVRIELLADPVDPTEIGAALLIPLHLIHPVPGTVVFYARDPTAFADLAATLANILDVEPDAIDQHPPLPDSPLIPGVSGLMDFTVVNRAVGVLVNRGHSLPSARAELRRRTDSSDVDLPTAAQALLDAPF